MQIFLNKSITHSFRPFSPPTCSVRNVEPPLLHRVVGEKAQEHFVAAGNDGRRLLGAAEAPEARRPDAGAVEDLKVVVGALQVGLHVHFVENLKNRKCPH